MEEIEELKKIVAGLQGQIDDLKREVSTLRPKQKSLPKLETVSDSSKVWEAYSSSYFDRYKTQPIRNAMTNKMIQNLISRLGLDPACRVVEYYVSQSDAFYLKKTHAFGLCLADCESLHTRWKTGLIVTDTSVKKTEKMSASLSASKSYLQKKYAVASKEGS